jgi:hypothetical protein
LTVLLRLLYLALSTMFTFMRLVPMSDREKDLEIPAPRHQPAVLQRTADRPQPTWPDQELLAALLHRFPRARLRRLRLIVSPDTLLRWHRDLILCRSKSHRCMSCRVSVLVDEAAEDPGAQGFAGAEAMRRNRLFVGVGW